MYERSGQNSPPESPQTGRIERGPLRARSKAVGIVFALLVAAYSFVGPQLNARFGWNLPQIRADSSGNVSRAGGDVRRSDAPTPGPTIRSDRTLATARRPTVDGTTVDGTTVDGTTVDGTTVDGTTVDGTTVDGATDEGLRYGLLREIDRDRYMSPAGLLYTPGSAEGHRLEHVRRHTVNDPGRPGSHGVFDGDMEGALKTIDLAYQQAKKGQRTTKKTDQQRTIYTVDLGKRIGYVGGRDGGRRKNPMARRVRIVVDGNRLITAYPM